MSKKQTLTVVLAVIIVSAIMEFLIPWSIITDNHIVVSIIKMVIIAITIVLVTIDRQSDK
ncbi:hypothetical protein [Weissella confusa]|uniref:hypothetical protein n=1 Tax=Weissella confusa TaxID=1583 RepID=UPI000B350BD4|nr:hypothetical protein [Weissella confusa]